MTPYSPRTIRFGGIRHAGRWRLKLYGITWRAEDIDWASLEAVLRAAEAALPEPDETQGRPGLGLLIVHQGRTGDYIVLGWWNSENELPLRVWVRRDGDEGFRPARDGESICVWDLEVIWAERQAWVRTMLIETPRPGEYLNTIHRCVNGESSTTCST